MEATSLNLSANSAAQWLRGFVGAPLISAEAVTKDNAMASNCLGNPELNCQNVQVQQVAHWESSTHQMAKLMLFPVAFAATSKAATLHSDITPTK